MTDADRMNREREEMLLAYLRGELSAQEEAELRQRLADDPEYAERLEELLLGEEEPLEKGSDKSLLESLPEDKQRAIIRRGKWKSRLSNAAYTVGISLLIGIAAWLVNFWIGRSLYDETYRVSKDLVNFTQPGIEVGSSGAQVGLLYGKIQMEMRERIGGDRQRVGSFETTNVLYKVSARPVWNNGFREKHLFFLFPLENTPSQDHSYRRDPAWSTLEKLPEGTVSQLAISFDHLMSLRELYQFLAPYDLDLTWLAVDTGQERKHEMAKEGVVLLSAGEIWGYPENGLDFGEVPIIVRGEEERRTAAYVAEMKYLAEQKRLSQSIAESLIFQREGAQIQERYQYLEENGVKIYGVVVTGATKELLRLKQEPSITAAFLGKIDWWNLNHPSASGEQNSW
ncbi:anti-sigma factor [Brevibacillus ruminantium]|uniref:Anti-sigma factor n=1 Tax=Brevibacillus ruminantium TaxID=2950604 RepID=A0ABY4WIM5_9BACL|nr:anti-sigma factor [Brevibacillus ruminantium]USG66729.1 anti-sigma factor [Brevibacillus ruminantium]